MKVGVVCTRRAAGALAALAGALALALLPTRARAEEGLFTMRAAGGLSTAAPDAPHLGGVALAGWTLGWTDAVAVTMTAGYVGHAAFDVATLGLGLRVQGDLGEWTHPFALVEPSLLVAFDTPGDDPATLDAGVRASLGVDYLVLWGLGLVIELTGTVPAGLGRLRPLEAATASVAVGLYMEF